MDYSFKPTLNSDFILSRYSEEQIMEYYLGVRVQKGLFKSTLRTDNHSTCSFYRNKSKILIFKDFATGQHLNCFNVVMEKYHCSYYEALKIIANDFGLIKDESIQKNNGKINQNPVKIEDKEFSKIQIEAKDFTDLELKWWNKFGITKEILDKFNVYSCKHIFLNNRLFAKSQQHCPIYGYYGGKIEIDGNKEELWRIYFCNNKDYRFLSNWSAKKIQGYEQLPKKGKLLVITKSLKDCMSLYSCGINAIAPNSENLFISEKILENLKERFKYIVVFYDSDIPGVKNMRKIKKEHPELKYFFIPRKHEAKDISDFYAKYGRKETLEFLKSNILKLNG